jgi:amino acid transporter
MKGPQAPPLSQKGGVHHQQADYAPPLPQLPAVDAAVPNVGVVKLAALTFFAVAGGPYGVEPLVQAGGAGWALLGLLTVPWIWGLPTALMTAELSTALPESGGYIVWVNRAFGDFWAVQMSVWTLVNSLLDNAMYPIMFCDYIAAFRSKDWEEAAGSGSGLLDDSDDSEPSITWGRWILGMSMVVPVLLLNLRGVDVAGDFAVGFAILVIAPFVVLFAIGIPDINMDALTAPPTDGHYDWGNYVTVLLWNTCGYDSAGTLAAEVANPGKVFVPSMMLSIIAVVSVYFLPIMVGVCKLTDSRKWYDGYWPAVGYYIGGNWLAAWVTFAGAVSCAGQLNTNFATNAQAFAAMGRAGIMPSALGYTLPKWGTPWVALLLMGLVQCVLMCADFESILAANMITYDLTIVLEYAALIKLRRTEPELERPYRIPLHGVGLWLLFIPPTLLTLVLVALADWITLVAAAAVVLLGLLTYYVRRHCLGDKLVSCVPPCLICVTRSCKRALKTPLNAWLR